MLQTLSGIVKNIAVIILLTTFLDMLLPNSNMQRFIKVVMGLFVMLAILNPIISLLTEEHDLSAWQLSASNQEKVGTVLAQGQQISNLQQKQAIGEYQRRVEKQIEALVELTPDIKEAKCSVNMQGIDKLGAIGKIENATIWVNMGEDNSEESIVKPVDPVEIQLSSIREEEPSEDENLELKSRIINIIANYYSIDKKNIQIIFY